MRKVIKGKMYDTETAEFLANYSNMPYQYNRDFEYYEENLYKTKSGQYFLHAYGGANSKYNKQISYNEWSGDELIIPITIDEAKEWAEDCVDGDKYEEIFGVITEDDTNVRIGTTIAPETKQIMDAERSRRGVTYGEIIDELVQKYLK